MKPAALCKYLKQAIHVSQIKFSCINYRHPRGVFTPTPKFFASSHRNFRVLASEMAAASSLTLEVPEIVQTERSEDPAGSFAVSRNGDASVSPLSSEEWLRNGPRGYDFNLLMLKRIHGAFWVQVKVYLFDRLMFFSFQVLHNGTDSWQTVCL